MVATISFAVLGLVAISAATTLVSADNSDTIATGDDESPPNLQIYDSVTSPDGEYVYVVGTLSHSDSPGTKTSGSWSGFGDADLFVAKYDQSGSRVTAYVEDVGVVAGSGGVGGDDYGKAIAVDPSGNVYVTGQAYSSGRTYSKFFVRKLTSSLATVGNPYFYSNGAGNHLDTGNDIAVVDVSGTTYAYAVGTVGNGSTDTDIQVMKLHWSGTSSSLDWGSSTVGYYAGGSSSNDAAVKLVAQSDTITIGGSPSTGVHIYVAGQRNADALCMDFDDSGGIIASNTYNYASQMDQVTGLAVASGSDAHVYVSMTCTRTGGTGTDMVLAYFNKGSMAVNASAWTGTWHSECTPSTGSVGVVIEPDYGKPIVGGFIKGSSLEPPDFMAVPWSSDALTPGTEASFGAKYDYDIPGAMAMDELGRIYIVGTKQRPTTVMLGSCPESPCSIPQPACTDAVGAMRVEAQAYIVSFTVSGGTSIGSVASSFSTYSRIHTFPQAAANHDHVFASYDHIPVPIGYNVFVDVFYEF